MTRIEHNVQFANSLKTYSWDELIHMHKFYMIGYNGKNQQIKDMLSLIERELTIRCLDIPLP